MTLNSYTVDTATGALTPLQTITYPPNTSQSGLVVHPSGKFLYVDQSPCVLAYLIDPATGSLTQSSCSAGSAVSVIPAPGDFAYQGGVSSPDPGGLTIYSVNQSDGSLTQLQTLAHVGGIAFTDPLGRAIYLLGTPGGAGGCGSFAAFQIDPSSGSLTNLNTAFSAPCDPFGMTFNPVGTFAYVSSGKGESGGSPAGIYGGTIDATGNLTLISGSPFASSAGVNYGAVEPSQGKFVIEDVNGTPNAQLLVYAIDPSTGALTQVAGVQASLPSANNYVFKMLTVAPQPAN